MQAEKGPIILPTMANQSSKSQFTSHYQLWKRVIALGAITASVWLFLNRVVTVEIRLRSWNEPNLVPLEEKYKCRPPLPFNLIQNSPPTAEDPAFQAAAWQLANLVSQHATEGYFDSVVIGIVGSDGLIWSTSAGRLKANGSEYELPDIHSIYRIASISKMFAVMETHILRDRGILNWDDPVQKHLKNFTYNPISWKAHIEGVQSDVEEQEPITLRMLASHMSGIGKNLPPPNFDWWPIPPPGSPPAGSEIKVPTLQEAVDSVAEMPLVAPPYTFPVYSNAGFSMLGGSITAAVSKAEGKDITYPDLMERDIFKPLGMNGSSFAASEGNYAHLAIPSIGTDVDIEFPDTTNAMGGQFSSVSDLAKAVQSFLTPHRHLSLLSSTTKREWLRPSHAFPDSYTETGLVWEIFKAKDSHGRTQQYYTKGGSLPFFRSKFAINPDLQFGIVILLAGLFDQVYFQMKAIELFQPVFESHLEKMANERYAGVWKGKGRDEIHVEFGDGSLWITKWLVNDIDFIKLYFNGLQKRVLLWSTGRLDEFRIAVGIPEYNVEPLAGCNPYWFIVDAVYSHNAPFDLVYFDITDTKRVLKFPSANATLYQ